MRLQGTGTHTNTGEVLFPSQGTPRQCQPEPNHPEAIGQHRWAGSSEGEGRAGIMPSVPGASLPIGLSAGEKGQGGGRALSGTWLDATGRHGAGAWWGGVWMNRQWRNGSQPERGAEECPLVKRRPWEDTDTG